MKNLIIVLGITTCIAGYAAPAAADDLCYDVCRWARRQVESDREAERRNDRLQREWDADRQQANADHEYEQRERYYDRTICQPGEDCRRTLWRSRR